MTAMEAPAPTPAERRELLAAIANDGKVLHRAGAGASRVRASLLRKGWTEAGRVTDAGRRVAGQVAEAAPVPAATFAESALPRRPVVICQYGAQPHPFDDECVNVRYVEPEGEQP